jgi:mannose-6-phosphate isomerase-like protein (cupin superfamily)
MPEKRSLVVVRPGQGTISGDVEFLATSDDTPRLNVSTILIDPWSKGVPVHQHADEDDAFYVLEGQLTFVRDDGEVTVPAGTFVLARPGVSHGFHNRTAEPVRLLNIHAPAGFDRRIGLQD